jgi:hypothetical protein
MTVTSRAEARQSLDGERAEIEAPARLSGGWAYRKVTALCGACQAELPFQPSTTPVEVSCVACHRVCVAVFLVRQSPSVS